MKESLAGKSIIAQLKKKRETSISKFKSREKGIFDKEKKLISQKNVLSKEEFESKLKDLRNDISNYQKDRSKKSNEITKSRVKASTKLINKLTPILEEYSKKNSIRIIVQKKNIIMGKKRRWYYKRYFRINKSKGKKYKNRLIRCQIV